MEDDKKKTSFLSSAPLNTTYSSLLSNAMMPECPSTNPSKRKGYGKRLKDYERMEILDLLNMDGVKLTNVEVAQRYGISEAAIRKLKKNQESFRRRYYQTLSLNDANKRLRTKSTSEPATPRTIKEVANVVTFNGLDISVEASSSSKREEFGKTVIHKFGGTSMATAECFETVCDILYNEMNIKQEDQRDYDILGIVISAIGGKPKVTDLLIDLVNAAKEIDIVKCNDVLRIIKNKHDHIIDTLLPKETAEVLKRELDRNHVQIEELLRAITIMRTANTNVLDYIIGHGELWCTKILTAYLNYKEDMNAKENGHRKIEFFFYDTRGALIVETNHDNVPIIDWQLSSDLLKQNLEKFRLEKKDPNSMIGLVITGFICSTKEGTVTTLQRDGSDYTASIYGSIMHSESINIWTDVDGILTADPRRVANAKILKKISYCEAMELAYFGAKVIHPKTMVPAIENSIPIYIRNTFNPSSPGTKISASSASSDIAGLSSIDKLALFNLEGPGLTRVHGVSSRLFTALEETKINIVLIAQASSEHSICFAVPMKDVEEAKDAVETAFFKEIHYNIVNKLEYEGPVSVIAAIGDRMLQSPGICARFLGALGRAGVNVLALSQGSSETNISAVVLERDSTIALRAAHAAFFSFTKCFALSLVNAGTIEDTYTCQIILQFLKLLQDRSLWLREYCNVEIFLRSIVIGNQMLLANAKENLSLERIEQLLTSPNTAHWEPFQLNPLIDHLKNDHNCVDYLIVDFSTLGSILDGQYTYFTEKRINVISANINAALSTGPKRKLSGMTGVNKFIVDFTPCLMSPLPFLQTVENFSKAGNEIYKIEAEISSLHFDQTLYQLLASEQSLETIAKTVSNDLTPSTFLEELTGIMTAKKSLFLVRQLGYDYSWKDLKLKTPFSLPDNFSFFASRNIRELEQYWVANCRKVMEHLPSCESGGRLGLITTIMLPPSAVMTVTIQFMSLTPEQPLYSMPPKQNNIVIYPSPEETHLAFSVPAGSMKDRITACFSAVVQYSNSL